MKLILCLLLAGLATPVLFAAETAPDSGVKPPPYKLNKRSSFEMAANARPPFWPIGWVKRERGSPPVPANVPRFVLEARNFSVTSILLGPPAIAVINGRAYEEGQIVRTARVPVPTAASAPAPAGPRVRVHRIAEGQVWLQCDGQIVNVAMKRQELSERKAPDELLSSERHEDAPLPAVSAR